MRFDPRRQAILLAAGDKSGDWKGWYQRNIPLADQRYSQHLADIERDERRTE
ncbi:type II toxin-antitoxin system RelE/ParE family toxin [Tamaricihabitans halophyticus]|uniref:type II toxin-antitoxin system RelE/ParE family toxin n=1 Tax=Tamaricihabitans halophyticus TaxID=1262583 RepID=UPI00311E6813